MLLLMLDVVLPPLSVNASKNFAVFWVKSRVCSVYLEDTFSSWNSFENETY